MIRPSVLIRLSTTNKKLKLTFCMNKFNEKVFGILDRCFVLIKTNSKVLKYCDTNLLESELSVCRNFLDFDECVHLSWWHGSAVLLPSSTFEITYDIIDPHYNGKLFYTLINAYNTNNERIISDKSGVVLNPKAFPPLLTTTQQISSTTPGIKLVLSEVGHQHIKLRIKNILNGSKVEIRFKQGGVTINKLTLSKQSQIVKGFTPNNQYTIQVIIDSVHIIDCGKFTTKNNILGIPRVIIDNIHEYGCDVVLESITDVDESLHNICVNISDLRGRVSKRIDFKDVHKNSKPIRVPVKLPNNKTYKVSTEISDKFSSNTLYNVPNFEIRKPFVDFKMKKRGKELLCTIDDMKYFTGDYKITTFFKQESIVKYTVTFQQVDSNTIFPITSTVIVDEDDGKHDVELRINNGKNTFKQFYSILL